MANLRNYTSGCRIIQEWAETVGLDGMTVISQAMNHSRGGIFSIVHASGVCDKKLSKGFYQQIDREERRKKMIKRLRAKIGK